MKTFLLLLLLPLLSEGLSDTQQENEHNQHITWYIELYCAEKFTIMILFNHNNHNVSDKKANERSIYLFILHLYLLYFYAFIFFLYSTCKCSNIV